MSDDPAAGPSPSSAASASRDVDPELLSSFRAGRQRALARAITMVENETPGFEALLDELHEEVGTARRVGITGPPGAGKSTLTRELARRYREEGLRVGMVAVDPTSPFSGGAVLGDRVRMGDLASGPDLFFRSMATRGAPGGLATATRETADLMDAFGMERILLETVGVGQSELEIARAADTTAVVLVPESGDGIQAMKAGLNEIADLFVLNKADRPGAARLKQEIVVMIRTRRREGAGEGGESWEVPVLETVASEGEGVDGLARQLSAHHRHLEETEGLARRRREVRVEQARSVLRRRVDRDVEETWRRCLPEVREQMAAGELSPYAAADRVYRRLRSSSGTGPDEAAADR